MDLPEEKKSYHKLTAFQKSKELVLLVYKITRSFPKEELFGLVSQMRRAAVSIIANIVEGYSKNSTREYLRFLDIATGSINELELYIELSLALNYFSVNTHNESLNLLTEVKKLLYTYKSSLERKIN